MLLNTGTKDKNGNVIYVNKFTGKKSIAQRLWHKVGNKIPSYAFSFISKPFKNPESKF